MGVHLYVLFFFITDLADAVRQTSLGNSSKMGELLDRFVQGKPCGTPQDIDFLIDEVIKRIEK